MSYTCGPGTSYHMTGVGNPGYVTRGNPWVLGGPYVQDAINEAFYFFASGCVEQEVLLANFAWELPDVRNLPSTIIELLKLGKDILRPSARMRDLTFRDIKGIKPVASADLAYEFGVKPLIKDVMSIINRIKTLDEHIEWLKKNSLKKTKVVFRKKLDNNAVVGSVLPSMPSYPSGNICLWRIIDEMSVSFNAWAVIEYDVSVLVEQQLKLATLLRSFGLNNPAAVVWEAIPFSFVVDWFVNVGDALKSLQIPIIIPNIIHDCGYGVTVRSKFSEYFKSYTAQCLMRETITKGYSRRPGLPVSIPGLNLETPGVKQLVLGLALAAQRL